MKRPSQSHGQRLKEHLETTAAIIRTTALDRMDAKVAAILKLAMADAVVGALVKVVVERNAYFAVSDVLVTPDTLLRGKKNETWNAGERVIGARDLAIARNGGGDLFVWNADDGTVRFVIHDEGWVERRRHGSLDDFLEQELYSAVESLEADDLEEFDETQRKDIELAIQIAGVHALNDDVRDKLVELGWIEVG
jgi:hypothetical protein